MPDVLRIPTPHSYSAAVAAGDLVFLGLHRGFGETFEEQLHDALRQVGATLEQCGAHLHDLVKVQVWLADVADLPAMEHAFVEHFPADGFPARMTATTQFWDADCRVMVEGVAYRGQGRP